MDDYESKLKVVGKFETCEQFWTLYSYLKRPHEFETLTEIHIFKDGELALFGCSSGRMPSEYQRTSESGQSLVRV